MAEIIRQEDGIYVKGIPGIPDGTKIPYDYDPDQDNTTPDSIKQIVIKVLNYVAQQDAQMSMGAQPQSVAGAPGGGVPRMAASVPSGGVQPGFDTMGFMSGKATNFLDRAWSWQRRAEPTSVYSRTQQYMRQAAQATKKPKAVKKAPAKRKTTKRTKRTK